MRQRLAATVGLLVAASAPAAELLVAGQDSQAVLGFDAASSAFTRVFAQTIAVGFRNPGGIALRPSDGALFVSSRGTGEIWRYDTATGAVVTPAVKTGLMTPNGIDFAASSASLYFADAKDINSESADAVKRLDVATGAVTTLGSTASAEFADVAVNGSDVFAVDSDGSRVVRFPAAGGAGATVIGSGLSQPSDLAFRSSTRLLVADTGTDRVLEYLNSGGSWAFDRVVLPASAGVADPCALAIAPSGALAVSGCLSNNVVLVDLTTLAVTPLITAGGGGLASPKDLAYSGATLLVANPVANAVVFYDASGATTGVRAQGITSALDGGIALSADESRVAIASLAADEVIEHAAATGVVLRTFGDACGGQFPSDVAYGPSGALFVACFGSSGVNRIDAATGAVTPFVSGGSGGLSAPRQLAFGPNGNLFVSSASGEILEFGGASGSPLGAFVDAGGNGGGPLDPYGFAFHSGQLYVTSFFTDSVAVFHGTSGAFVATRVASGSGGLDEPTAVAFAADGSLLVASHADDAVRRYDAGTGAYLGAFVASGSHGLDGPVDLAVRGLPEPAAALALAAGSAALAALGRSRRGRR
jgi:DNA-binding beta-propeller fold protein YncE